MPSSTPDRRKISVPDLPRVSAGRANHDDHGLRRHVRSPRRSGRSRHDPCRRQRGHGRARHRQHHSRRTRRDGLPRASGCSLAEGTHRWRPSFGSYQVSRSRPWRAASASEGGRRVREAGGWRRDGRDHQAITVSTCPSSAHRLTPQSYHRMAATRCRASSAAEAAAAIVEDAHAVGRRASQVVPGASALQGDHPEASIPTIGIGAGPTATVRYWCCTTYWASAS